MERKQMRRGLRSRLSKEGWAKTKTRVHSKVTARIGTLRIAFTSCYV